MKNRFFNLIFICAVTFNLSSADVKQSAETIQNRADWIKKYALLDEGQRILLLGYLLDLAYMEIRWDNKKNRVYFLRVDSWHRWEAMKNHPKLAELVDYVLLNQFKNINCDGVNSKEKFLAKAWEILQIEHLAYYYYDFVYNDLKKGKFLYGNAPSVAMLKELRKEPLAISFFE